MRSAEPPRLLYAEEIPIGAQIDLGNYQMTAAEITSFGAKWDPLPLHLSEDNIEETAFGRLVASGVHTLAVFQRLAVTGAYAGWDIFAGRRLDDVRFLGPVFPGDDLRAALIVQSVEMNHPGRGLVTCFGWIDSGNGRVLELVTESYVNRRPRTDP